MPLPARLAVALKEWATVCAALASGRQMILLRKGGIIESGGKFEIQNHQFLLFPTVIHQNLAMLKPSEHAGFTAATTEPGQITFSIAAEITDIIPMPSRAAMDGLNDQHIWASPLIDMRFNYKPKNPLYLLLVRAYRLAQPTTIENTLTYAGCMSWVPLDHAVPTSDCQPVLDDAAFADRRKVILDRIE